jgi:hypothetical protein
MPRDLSRSPLLIQVLSVYLLLLAFFILLNNVASVETARSKAVAGSLRSTFASEGRLTEFPTVQTSALGTVLADAALEERLGVLVRTELGFAELRVIEPGRTLELSLGERALFRGGGIAIDPLRRAFVERIAAIVADPPVGVRYDTDILLAGALLPARSGAGAAVDEPAARAAFLAAVLIGAGAPGSTVAAGVESGREGRLRLLFSVRPRVEPLLFAAPEPAP